MLDYGFNNYRLERAYEQGEAVRAVPVLNGMEGAVNAAAEGGLSGAVRIGAPVDVVITLPEQVEAPVRAGEILGTAAIRSDGGVIAQCNLVAVDGVEKLDIRQAFKRLLRQWTLLFQ